MRVYIAGPVTGKPGYNREAFREAAIRWRASGHSVVSPIELAGADRSRPWAFYLRRDLAELVTCDAVVLLPGWEQSRGARLEVYVAQALGMALIDDDSGNVLSPTDIFEIGLYDRRFPPVQTRETSLAGYCACQCVTCRYEQVEYGIAPESHGCDGSCDVLPGVPCEDHP